MISIIGPATFAATCSIAAFVLIRWENRQSARACAERAAADTAKLEAWRRGREEAEQAARDRDAAVPPRPRTWDIPGKVNPLYDPCGAPPLNVNESAGGQK